jgi:hypothetical protein
VVSFRGFDRRFAVFGTTALVLTLLGLLVWWLLKRWTVPDGC